MKQPIFVYYQLDNFYQNHRRYAIISQSSPPSNLLALKMYFPCLTVISTTFRYVKSRSDAQLRDRSKAGDTSTCDPEATVDGKPIVPCGLIAWSLFNDTYNLIRNNQNLTVDKKDISWKSDREHKFGKDVFPSNFQKGPLQGGKILPNVSVGSWFLICI
jgi:hypothetical protein